MPELGLRLKKWTAFVPACIMDIGWLMSTIARDSEVLSLPPRRNKEKMFCECECCIVVTLYNCVVIFYARCKSR